MDYYDFSKQGGLWGVQYSSSQDDPRCVYSRNYKGQLWVLVWFGDCSSVVWCGFNVGNCMGVEQICWKLKNLNLWLCSHVELCQVYLQNMYNDEDKKGASQTSPSFTTLLSRVLMICILCGGTTLLWCSKCCFFFRA